MLLCADRYSFVRQLSRPEFYIDKDCTSTFNANEPESMSNFTESSVSTVFLNTSLGQIKAKSKSVQLLEDSVSGNSEVSVVQSLGLPFADIPYRWAAPRLILSYGREPIDATTFGPACPQFQLPAFNSKDIPLFGLSRKDGLHIYAASEDEFKCLNLNIYCPQQLVESGKPVPVLVCSLPLSRASSYLN